MTHRSADYSHGVLIADAVSDPFVHQLVLNASRIGFKLEPLTYVQAAVHFTVCTASGSAQVLPHTPIFMRAPHYAQIRAAFDADFLTSEAIHAVWAAAALTSAPVINRPGLHALVGRFGPTRACVEHRAGLASNAHWESHSCADATQMSASGEHNECRESDGCERWDACPVLCELVDSDRPCHASGVSGIGRLQRLRPAAAAPGCSLCICVGESSWCVPCRGHDPDELKTRTHAAMKRLNLNFGAVLWSRGTDGNPWPACITPEPCLDWLEFAWDEIATTLLERLRWASSL